MQPRPTPDWANLRRLAIAAIVVTALLAPAMHAQAIIGGSAPDDVRPYAYPYVGGAWIIDDNGNPVQPKDRVRATGILIAPNVVLTEGASFKNGRRVAVSFGSPIPDAERKNPLYRGYLFRDDDPNSPLRFNFDGPFPLHDVAVIILEQPVVGIAPITLAANGALNAVKRGSSVTAISYGPTDFEVSTKEFTRRFANWQIGDVTKTNVRLDVPDDGLTCNGDQGGPLLRGNAVVAVIENWQSICETSGVAYGYRLDTQDTRAFLCFVSQADLDAQNVSDPDHPDQVVNYPDLSPASQTQLGSYCNGKSTASGAGRPDNAHETNSGHKHERHHGGHHQSETPAAARQAG